MPAPVDFFVLLQGVMNYQAVSRPILVQLQLLKMVVQFFRVKSNSWPPLSLGLVQVRTYYHFLVI